MREALEHPWLASYHDVNDEPGCPEVFERWRDIEKLETLPQFREAIFNEIEDYRNEVRSIFYDAPESIERSPSLRRHPRDATSPPPASEELRSPFDVKSSGKAGEATRVRSPEGILDTREVTSLEASSTAAPEPSDTAVPPSAAAPSSSTVPPERPIERERSGQADPIATYVRRSSIMQPSRQSSLYSASAGRARHSIVYPPESRTSLERATDGLPAGESSSIAFPGGTAQEYVVPARSRTGSMMGDTATRRLLRTLSTVSIYESGEGHANGLADIAPIGKFIVERDEGLPSEMPRELGSQSASPPQPKSQPRSGEGEERKESEDPKEGCDAGRRDKTRFRIEG